MNISIIEFSVENFKLFKERITFSMLARKSKNTFNSNGEKLLKTSLIYGANASGKSTLLEAFGLLKKKSSLLYKPFALFSERYKSVFCEIVFSMGEKIFKYNFSFLENGIIAENLFEILVSGKEKKYFTKGKQGVKIFVDFENNANIIKQINILQFY